MVQASDHVFFSLAQVAQSIEDHHQEVIGFCRENGFHGLVAYDSDYALCNIPYYFSAHALKLSRNGKSLTTSQYLMHEVAKQLDLNPNRFPIFAALLGRCTAGRRSHVLKEFYTRNMLILYISGLGCFGLYLKFKRTREWAVLQKYFLLSFILFLVSLITYLFCSNVFIYVLCCPGQKTNFVNKFT